MLWAILAVVAGVTAAAIVHGQRGRSRATAENAGPASEIERLNQQLSAGRHGTSSAPIVATTKKAVEQNPLSPEYDPVLVSAVYERHVRELYEDEPRTEPFASEREAFLQSIVGADLEKYFPAAGVAGVECRTSSCVIRLEVPASQWKNFHQFIQHPSLGEAINPGHRKTSDPEVDEVSLAVLFTKDQRVQSTYEAWYRKTREEQLPALRELGMWPTEPE